MFALLAAFVTAILFTSGAAAQNDLNYTVWSSVIFSRTGERTPAVLGDIPTQLTTLGAQQQYSAGSFFRERYLGSVGSTDGVDSGPIAGLSAYTPDIQQLYVLAIDMQTTIASAQAFLQGFYPPFNLTSNDTEVRMLNPTSILANNSYVASPLNGYQYGQVHVAGGYDPEFPYLGANIGCPGYDSAIIDYILTDQFAKTQAESQSLYNTIGRVFLGDVLEAEQWNYVNAYAIYDYLSYQNQHDSAIYSLLGDPKYTDSATKVSYLDSLRYYADQQQYAQLGNLYADNNFTGTTFPSGTIGSISTISGNFLAAKMIAQLQGNIQSQGEYYKLSLLFGDFQPLLSLFALLGLPYQSTDFYGLPEYASTAVFELYSRPSSSYGTAYPSEDDLWVRFYFRNGTDSDEPYQAYSLFGNGPDAFEMQWTDFYNSMSEILIGDIGIWCQQCGAYLVPTDRYFCAYWNTSDSIMVDSNSGSSHGAVSPAVGGVIGAIVALVVAGILFGAVMLIGGVRLHRVQRSHKSDLGGFKGSQKMASDKDLVLPKGGAVVGATVENPSSPVAGGHERVGSWELKQHDIPNIAAPHPAARRPSFEEDGDVGDIGAAPFREPVKPDERV